MQTEKKSLFFQELRWLSFAAALSFCIWCILTLLSDQSLVVDTSRYNREWYGFITTIGFIYFLRISGRWVNLS